MAQPLTGVLQVLTESFVRGCCAAVHASICTTRVDLSRSKILCSLTPLWLMHYGCTPQSYNMVTESRALRLATRIRYEQKQHLGLRNARKQRFYATHKSSSRPTRRAITVTSDDGRYHWSELSTGEKAARSTQQSFNFLFASAGAIGTVCSRFPPREPLLMILDLCCLSSLH